MGIRVVLCADGQSLRNPAMVGLAGEALDSFPWLACASGAQECRSTAEAHPEAEEAWVVSCDDMDPINVAAAMKRDSPERRVYLVSCGQNGSLASRAASARIDGLWSESGFVKRYAQAKLAFAGEAGPHAGGGGNPAAQPAPSATPERSAATAALHSAEPVDPEPAVEPRASAGGRQEPPTRSYAPPSGPPQASAQEQARPLPTALPARVTSTREQTAVSGTLIAVASGSGGCGKSTVAALFAALAARAGLRCVLLDADLQFGDAHHLLGAADPLRIEDAVAEPARMRALAEQAHRREGKPAVVAAPRRLETSESVVAELPRIAEACRIDYDVVVANTGSFWSDVHAHVLDAADATVMLMDARPGSLRAATHAVELCARIGVATGGFTFAVNRHGRESLLSAVDAACALRGARAVELPDGGREVDELLGAGYVDEFIDSKNPLVSAALGLMEGLLPEARRAPLSALAEEFAAKRKRTLFGKGGRP